MNDPTQVTTIHQSIDIETTPETVFAVLTDPNMITRYAGGIEGAEVMERPIGPDDCTGAKLQLVTKSNNILRAEVIECDAPYRLVVRDERGVLATWQIEDIGKNKVRLTNTISGPIPPLKAQEWQYDTDVKFQALQSILEEPEGYIDQSENADKARPTFGEV